MDIHFSESYGHLDGKRRRSYYYDIKWRMPGTGEKRRKFKRSSRSKAAAKRAARALMAEVERNGGYTDEEMATRKVEQVDDEDQTVAEFVQFWEDQKLHPSIINEDTIVYYRRDLKNHVIPRFGSMRLKDVRARDVQAWIGDLQKPNESRPHDGYAPLTVRLQVAIFSQVLAFAVRLKAIEDNPAKGLILPGNERLREVIIGNPELVNDALSETEGDRMYALMHVAFGTGLRRGELAGLQWCDIDFAAGKLSVIRQRKRAPNGWVITPLKSKASRRRIAVPANTLEVLDEYRQQQQDLSANLSKEWADSGWVFCSPRVLPYHPDYFSQRFPILMKAAGYPGFTLHMARHAHATILADKKENPRVLQLRMGHSNIVTTLKYYVHVDDDMDAAAAALFNSIFI